MAQMAMAARGENFSTLVGVRVLDFSDPSAVGKEMGLLQGDAKSKLLDPKSGAFGGPPKHTSTSTSAADCLKSQNISQHALVGQQTSQMTKPLPGGQVAKKAMTRIAPTKMPLGCKNKGFLLDGDSSLPT